jgi:hypothetical protein
MSIVSAVRNVSCVAGINVFAAINLYVTQYKIYIFEAYWFLNTPSGVKINVQPNLHIFYLRSLYDSYTTGNFSVHAVLRDSCFTRDHREFSLTFRNRASYI